MMMEEMFDDCGALGSSPSRLILEELSLEFDHKLDDAGYVVNNEEEVEENGGVYSDTPVQFKEEGKLRSIAERRAAKCGFGASRIKNVARFREDISPPLSSPSASAWSPFVTIPAGISPTALLDSPVMLPNSKQSPTTGTLPLPPLNHESFPLYSMSEEAVGDTTSDIDSALTFESRSSEFWPCISDLPNQPPMISEFPIESKENVKMNGGAADSSSEVIVATNKIHDAKRTFVQTFHTDNQVPPLREHIEGDDTGKHYTLEGYKKETYPPTTRTSEDGYNWRKYGQKQVKGSEYPRSYYKCTHPDCQVKKKVERSHDGQITEIIYKGAHNHHIPNFIQSTILGSPALLSEMPETSEAKGSYIKVEDGESWKTIQIGCNDIKVPSEWRPDGMEGSSSTSVVTDNSDPASTTQVKSMVVTESAANPEFSSTNGNLDIDDEDGLTHGIFSPGDDGDEDKSNLKKRKKGNFLMESNLLSRAMREPRVVVQIESEVDILDDGYRWRKYGQKVVKGNPNPRSYYKCTSPGCSVRKHVERASDNLKAVLTTYEGKHNHEVPAARNSSHANMDVGNLAMAATNTPPNLALPRIGNVPKSEPQVQDLPFRFERKYCNDYMTPSNLVGTLSSEASSIYQGKYVPFQNSMPLGIVPPALPNFPMSLPMSIPQPANMVRRGFGFNSQVKPMGQPFLGGQQYRENSARFLKPKQEHDENIYDSILPAMDHVNDSPSGYHRVISSFPS